MATGADVARIAKGQVGYHEYGSNGNKYASAVGAPNYVPWCAIFVAWCFKKAGMAIPFGKCWYVPTIASKLAKKRVSSPQAGDIRIVSGNSHIGIYVGGGKVVAGNSSDKVSYESGGGKYYRPSYSGTSSSTGTSSSGSSSSSGTTTAPYKEYYVTKPTEITHVKDVIYSSTQPDLSYSIRALQLQEDWDLTYNTTNSSIASTAKKNSAYVYEISAETLYKEYYKMINSCFKTNLVRVYSPVVGTKYFIFNDTELNNCKIITYTSDLEEDDYIYYTYINEEWRINFNIINQRKNALKCYLEAIEYATSIFNTEAYQELEESIISNINADILDKYNELQEHLNTNIDETDYYTAIQDKIDEIAELTSNINIIYSKLLNYTNYKDLISEIKKYETLLENLQLYITSFKTLNFSDEYTYWNKNIIQNPDLLNFWLEFNDDNELLNYCIENIGNRSIVQNASNVSSIYYKNTPQIIFYTDDDQIDYSKTGYTYFKVNTLDDLFSTSQQGVSAKDTIDDLIYEHSYASQEITLSTIPIYYLEPNTRILIHDEKAHINNEYIISKLSNQLIYNGTTSITASLAPERLY